MKKSRLMDDQIIDSQVRHFRVQVSDLIERHV